jgi:hypothetical protein
MPQALSSYITPTRDTFANHYVTRLRLNSAPGPSSTRVRRKEDHADSIHLVPRLAHAIGLIGLAWSILYLQQACIEYDNVQHKRRTWACTSMGSFPKHLWLPLLTVTASQKAYARARSMREAGVYLCYGHCLCEVALLNLLRIRLFHRWHGDVLQHHGRCAADGTVHLGSSRLWW